MSDVFRAFAGAPESQFDLIACAVYSAAYTRMESGNKTQFDKLASDAKLYGGDDKQATDAIKALFGVKSINAAVKHFRKTYFAIASTLDQLGMPADMQKELPQGKPQAEARRAILDPLADAYAVEFASVFTAIVSMPEKTEAERTEAAAASKVKREAKVKAAEKQAKAEKAAFAKSIRAEMGTLEPVSLAEMARIVADALRAGALDGETEAVLMDAAQTREIAVRMADVVDVESREVVEPLAIA